MTPAFPALALDASPTIGSVFSTPKGRAHALILAQELAQGETLARVLHFLFSERANICLLRISRSLKREQLP
jgi:hypothetical protein